MTPLLFPAWLNQRIRPTSIVLPVGDVNPRTLPLSHWGREVMRWWFCADKPLPDAEMHDNEQHERRLFLDLVTAPSAILLAHLGGCGLQMPTGCSSSKECQPVKCQIQGLFEFI